MMYPDGLTPFRSVMPREVGAPRNPYGIDSSQAVPQPKYCGYWVARLRVR